MFDAFKLCLHVISGCNIYHIYRIHNVQGTNNIKISRSEEFHFGDLLELLPGEI